MFTVLTPTYTVRIRFKDIASDTMGAMAGMNALSQTVSPRRHKFADPIGSKTGCDEFIAAIKDALQKVGLGNAEVTFEKFEQS